MAVIALSKDSFQKEVFEHQGVVFVDFYADWCGPCKMTAPLIEQLSEEYKNVIKFVKINVDNNQELASQYGIFSIPTFIIFQNGKPVNQFVGAHAKDDFVREIKKVIGDG